jgi:peptidoglycan hydrolase-like protein with peptidoglycan-binding domain
MRVRLTCLALTVSIAYVARGDDELRSAQEELRRRNVYFGDIDGRQNQETAEALKRYQRRKGFAATGRADPATMRSLGLLARQPGEAAPRELPWPEEPILKSDMRMDPVAEARQVSRESGISVGDLLPSGVSNRRPHGQFDYVPVTASSSARGQRPNYRGDISPREKPGFRGSPELRGSVAASRTTRGFAAVTPGYEKLADPNLTGLVKEYLHAAGSSRPKNEIGLMADRVNYAGNGVLDRRLIERTLHDYYTRWPSRHYRLVGPVYVGRSSQNGTVSVIYQTDFTLHRRGATVRGRSENLLILNAGTSDPRIIGYQERRIPRL